MTQTVPTHQPFRQAAIAGINTLAAFRAVPTGAALGAEVQGVDFALPVSDEITVMYMLTNGIQQTEDFNDFKSSHFSAIVKPVGGVTWTTNYYFGQEQPDGGAPTGPDGFFRVFDTYIAYSATARLSVGLDVNYVTNEVDKADEAQALQGTGVYARYQVTSPAALSVRYERLDDEGLFGGIDQVLQEVTATAELNSTIRSACIVGWLAWLSKSPHPASSTRNPRSALINRAATSSRPIRPSDGSDGRIGVSRAATST